VDGHSAVACDGGNVSHSSWLAVVGLQSVDMDGPVTTLRGNVLVVWVPSDTLHVVCVVRELAEDRTWGSVTMLSVSGWATR
jgi:hypothetical protein